MAETSKEIKMKAVIFAGGVGTRMWPLSREKTPKQFEKIIDNQSTLQLAVKRLRPDFSWEDIFISSGKRYLPLIRKQLPRLPNDNFIGEPVMRDVAPAVGYASAVIAKISPNTPMVILWSDHLMKNVATFKKALQTGGRFISKNQEKFLFIGEKPRFANQNLGWIEVGKEIDKIDALRVFRFKSWKYRPNVQLARQFFRSSRYFWNPGYWVVMPNFVLQQYKRFMPQMYQKIIRLQKSFGQKNHQADLEKVFPTFEKISFDDAILEKLEPTKAVVLTADLGWSDIGNWQALKEALQKTAKENVVTGKVFLYQCEDSLIYNYTDQLVTTVDLDNFVVVNTDDVLLVCTKESMKNIKKVVNEFKQSKAYKKFT